MRGGVAAALAAVAAAVYYVDNSNGVSRTFDGIGGLSGGGATSRLLPTYPDQQRNEILDYLFKPNFGASLQILKVEIGGDAQSTDGGESSHMHDPWHEEYGAGYEWWLMQEAKARNPNIKLYGLPWAYPQWVTCSPGTLSNCTDSVYTYPQQTAMYVTKWVLGAKNTYNLTIDYLGIWNERPYDITYIITLRETLDNNGLQHVQIVAPDSNWGIASDILANSTLAESVAVIGAHYPGTTSSSQAQQTGKQLWASEDDSTFNNNVGTGCWARILNRNWVNGEMTGTICWNLVASYAKGFNWYRASIMTALQPYSGAYTVSPQVWATAHTTQFTAPGWKYLVNGTGPGTGSGSLSGGGSYVTLQSPDASDFTIVVEKMSRDHSTCVRPYLADYTTVDETATFQLAGSMAGATQVYAWYSHFAFTTGDTQVEFQQLAPIPVVNGRFTVNITVDSMYTFTTISTGSKGSYAAPPEPTYFPAAYTDNYNACPVAQEPAYWTDMNGAFECQDSHDPAHGIVMTQMTPLRPVTWGGDTVPHTLWAGGRDFVDVSFVQDVFIPNADSSAFLLVRGQGEDSTAGLIFAFDDKGNWNVSYSIATLTSGHGAKATGTMPAGFGPGQWHTYRLDINGSILNIWVDGASLVTSLNTSDSGLNSGHVGMGTVRYGQYPSYDNLQLYSTQTQCGKTPVAAGAPISLVQCSSEVAGIPGASWDFTPVVSIPGNNTGLFSLRNTPSLCLATNNTGAGTSWPVYLKACNPNDASQQWKQDYTTPYETAISSALNGGSNCLDIFGQIGDIGDNIDAWSCNQGSNQQFYWDPTPGELINIGYTVCLGVC